MIKRINLLSGPRNISTALMYSFAQRTDTKVFDEPLYAYYLKNSNAKSFHQGAEEILNFCKRNQLKAAVLTNKHGPHANHRKKPLLQNRPHQECEDPGYGGVHAPAPDPRRP